MVQWAASQWMRSVVSYQSVCFLEQDTFLSLLSTGWLQEQIQG